MQRNILKKPSLQSFISLLQQQSALSTSLGPLPFASAARWHWKIILGDYKFLYYIFRTGLILACVNN